jgi:hypothetical protein
MTGYDYWNPFSQAERRKEVQRDRDCFRTRAEGDADLLNQGRFKKETATTVVGATPSAPVPQQPATSPWGGDNPIPVGGELDYFDTDISAVEPILPERRDAPSNGLTSTVEHAPERSDGIAGLSTNPDAAAASFSSPDAAVVAQGGDAPSAVPSRKFKRRF